MHTHPKPRHIRIRRARNVSHATVRCLASALVLSALANGCAADLKPEAEIAEPNARVVTEPGSEGAFTTRVDASGRDLWIYFSFTTQGEVSPEDAANSPDWDIAFQRFNIISNGGASGSGGAAVAILDGESFENVRQAPIDGYIEDQPDSEDDDTVIDSAFAEGDGWYDYDSSDNTLSPKAIVYVVRTPSSAYYKLAFLDYYDDAGSSAHPSFNWAELPPP